MNGALPKRLRATREIQKKSQSTVADVIRVKRTTYGGYERGDIVPPLEKVQALAKFFGVTVDYLMGNTNFPTMEEAKGTVSNQTDLSFVFKSIIDQLNSKTALPRLDGELLNDSATKFLQEILPVILETTTKLNRN